MEDVEPSLEPCPPGELTCHIPFLKVILLKMNLNFLPGGMCDRSLEGIV